MDEFTTYDLLIQLYNSLIYFFAEECNKLEDDTTIKRIVLDVAEIIVKYKSEQGCK